MLPMARFEVALADYRKAEELGVRWWGYHRDHKWEQAKVLAHSGREDEGLELLDQVVASDPESYWGWHDRAWLLFHLGRVEDALADMDVAANLNPARSRDLRLRLLTFLPDSCDRIEALIESKHDEGVKGVGYWTAQIYLIMALRRPDIWPRGDLALLQAAKRVKGLADVPTDEQMIEISQAWRPWRAVAARLLWHFYLSERRRRS